MARCTVLFSLLAIIPLTAGNQRYTAAAEADRVDRVPFQPNVSFAQFAGFVNISDSSTRRDIFYWFVESERAPETDPLLLWTNGGGSQLCCRTEPCSVPWTARACSPRPPRSCVPAQVRAARGCWASSLRWVPFAPRATARRWTGWRTRGTEARITRRELGGSRLVAAPITV